MSKIVLQIYKGISIKRKISLRVLKSIISISHPRPLQTVGKDLKQEFFVYVSCDLVTSHVVSTSRRKTNLEMQANLVDLLDNNVEGDVDVEDFF